MKLNILIKWLHGILTKPLTILKSIYYNIKNKHQDLRGLRPARPIEPDKRLANERRALQN